MSESPSPLRWRCRDPRIQAQAQAQHWHDSCFNFFKTT